MDTYKDQGNAYGVTPSFFEAMKSCELNLNEMLRCLSHAEMLEAQAIAYKGKPIEAKAKAGAVKRREEAEDYYYQFRVWFDRMPETIFNNQNVRIS